MHRRLLATLGIILVATMLGSACAPPPAGPAAPQAEVIEVIDGDTVVFRTGTSTEHVRLIGIDTPEIAHHGNTADCFGLEAAQRTAELLPVGTVVRLARDIEARDIYDRLLAYVMTADGTMVNLQLAAEGYARPLSIAPNVTVADHFVEAAASAEDAGIGLWASCPQETDAADT